MTLAQFMDKPLSEALKSLNMIDSRIHSDDSGNVIAVELKYIDTEYKEETVSRRKK
jgi:hypothetical protein